MANAVISVPKGAGLENPRSAASYRPQTQIEIHTPSASYLPGSRIDPNNSFVSWTFQKILSSQDTTQEVGQVTLTLTAEPLGAPGQTWKDLVQPQDFVVIYASKNGTNLRTRFVGYVDDVYYSVDTSDAQNPQRNVQINVSDPMVGFMTDLVFTSVAISPVSRSKSANALIAFYNRLMEMALFWGKQVGTNAISWEAFLAELTNQGTRTGQFFALTPSQTVSAIIDAILSALYNPVVQIRNKSFAGHATWSKIVSRAFADTSQFSGSAYYITPQDGPIITNILSVMNAPFLEFFGDVRSADEFGANYGAIPKPSPVGITFGPDQAQFCVVIRPTPFDTTSGAPGTSSRAFEQLPMTDVWLKDTSGQSFYQTKEDVISYYYVYPEGYMALSNASLSALQAQYGAIMDTDAVTKYGLSAIEVPILGAPLSVAPSADDPYSPLNMRKWEQCLHDWYYQNPTYERGTITIHGDPSVRVGQRIRIPSLRLIAYVEGIQETFDRFREYTATVTFSRGVYY